MRTIRFGLLLVWLLSNPVSLVRAQQDETIYDKDIKFVEFEEMKYPNVAGMAHIEGVVVVRVKLDREGKVVDAMAISGNGLLWRASLENAKQWRFEPNSHNNAILVYNFRLIKGPAYCGPDNVTQFIFYPPNFVSVTGCGFTVQPH
jgi:TonB family protein